jgi:hypothetical protein
MLFPEQANGSQTETSISIYCSCVSNFLPVSLMHGRDLNAKKSLRFLQEM